MIAKDLMVGDWVQVNKEAFKVLAILHLDIISVSDKIGDFYQIDVNSIEPIPLTPEILEKNGFEFKWDGWIWCEDKEMETQNSFIQFSNGEVRIVEVNYLHKAATKFRNVQNVHELQHVLRLCGIVKEIEL